MVGGLAVCRFFKNFEPLIEGIAFGQSPKSFEDFPPKWRREGEGFFEGVHCQTFSEPMSTNFDNIYDLSTEQLEMLDDAEEKMLRNDLGAAEKLLLSMLKSDEECIPVLSNLGHLYGRHLSEFETAIEYYDRVLALEPDNAWARDARRRYLRYV